MLYRLKKVSWFVAVVGILLLFLFSTNPDRLPLIMLFVPFILIYVVTFLVLREITSLLLNNVSTDNRRWIVGGLSVLPVLMLLTLSAGQTEGTDLVLFALLAALLIFYFSRTNFLK